MKRSALYIFAAVVLTLWPLCVSAQDLVILHTNDSHSQIETVRSGKGAGLGGIHRRAEYFEQVRNENKDVLILDAGDFSQGTPYFTIFKGDLEVELMNELGYDVTAIGNHEFDNGIAELARRLRNADFQVVCANYDFSATELKDIIKPYVIVEKAGKKIGIIGLITELTTLVSKNNIEGMIFMDPIETANEFAEYLKDEAGCDLVIALTHLGYYDGKSDIKLAQNSKDIDIIIGGHSHTFLKSEKIYQNLNGNDVVVVQAGAHGEYVGRFDICF